MCLQMLVSVAPYFPSGDGQHSDLKSVLYTQEVISYVLSTIDYYYEKGMTVCVQGARLGAVNQPACPSFSLQAARCRWRWVARLAQLLSIHSYSRVWVTWWKSGRTSVATRTCHRCAFPLRTVTMPARKCQVSFLSALPRTHNTPAPRCTFGEGNCPLAAAACCFTTVEYRAECLATPSLNKEKGKFLAHVPTVCLCLHLWLIPDE